MAIAVGNMPWLPPELDGLRDYLGVRDIGAPSRAPSPKSISTTVGVAADIDKLEWEYSDPPPDERPMKADGFVIYVAFSDTGTPGDVEYLTTASVRSFLVVVPNGQVRSYAIAAFRFSHRGVQIGAKKQIAAWKGVT